MVRGGATRNDVTRSHMPGTRSHVIGTGNGRMRMRNQKVRNIRPIETFSPEVTSSNVTCNRRGSIGRVGCAHTQQEIGDFSLLESILTGNDVIQRREACYVI